MERSDIGITWPLYANTYLIAVRLVTYSIAQFNI